MKTDSILPLLCLTGLLAPAGALAALSVPEPDTVFYGQVVNRSAGHEQILQAGTLTWTLTDGQMATTLTTTIDVIGNQAVYRLKIPHSLAVNGLDIAAGSLPLGTAAAPCRHVSIAVNGVAAVIRKPGQQTFSTEVLQRAATHRLDLEISTAFADSDGDGLPDWWEEKHGLSKLTNDASLDKDADGVSNLAEYRAQTDPGIANRLPQLATTEVTAMADATSALLVRTMDSDTPPESLVYRVTSLSTPDALKLRRDGQESLTLAQDGTFTQADVNAGRLVCTHARNGDLGAVRLGLSVSDGTADHRAATGDVMIRFYRPTLSGDPAALASAAAAGVVPGVAAQDQAAVRTYLLARERPLLAWDLSSQLIPAAVSSTPATIFLGGAGADRIAGGEESDFIGGGLGDDILAGSGGADRFLISHPSEGNDTITDFKPAEGDVLELSGLFTGTSRDLRDYARLSRDTSGSTLGIDFKGTGKNFTDMTIRLSGLTATESDLAALHHSGRIVTTGLTLPASLTLLATQSSASENGPAAGVFTLTRLGPVTEPLTVTINLSGTATNGTDYEAIPPQIVIPAGQSTIDIPLRPYADTLAEPAEIALLTLQSSPAYAISGPSTAQVTIADLLPEISLEVLEPLAVLNSGAPGMIVVKRSGLMDRSVLVRLQAAGNATPGIDYLRIPSFVNLLSNQTTALLPVALAGAPTLTNGVEVVHVTVSAASDYLTGSAARATVHLVESEHSAAAWKATRFPGNQTPLAAFLAEPSGMTGRPWLLQYAFGPDSSPAVKQDGGHLSIGFLEDHAARDLDYIVEFSNDGRIWTTGAGVVEDITPLNPADARWSQWRAVRPAAADAAQFLRVRVQHLP